MSDEKHSWHLLGLGAIGCLYAAYLRRAGIALQVIVRNAAALQQLPVNGGITLQHGNELATVALDATTPAAIAEPIAQLLICTKAHQTLPAVAAIKNNLAAKPLLILLQNGMGVRELLQREIPDAIILHAISTEGAFRTTRFAVTHAGRGNTMIGAIDSMQQQYAKTALTQLRCELPFELAPDIEQRLWLKLGVNSVINPLSAIHRCRNGELLQLANIDAIVTSLCDELAALAQAERMAITAQQYRDAVYRVMRDTAENRSSMLQDIEAGRATEIDFINGYILRRAAHQNLDCPHHAQLLAAVHALEPARTAP